MDFGYFLLHAQVITQGEFAKTVTHQFKATIRNPAPNAFAEPSLFELTDLSTTRLIPFGDALETLHIDTAIYQRTGKTITDWVNDWRRWHLEQMEPISDYNLDSVFSQQLYRSQYEKQLVGAFLATAPAKQATPLVRERDYVVIPEGSSALYAAFGVAAFCDQISFITSNASLVREYLENPHLASKVDDFYVIGGQLDLDRKRHTVRHNGFVGDNAQDNFRKAIEAKPGATVVVCSVNGLLPDAGPFAPDHTAAVTRLAVLKAAFEQGVRDIVFIADYAKMLPSKRPDYMCPVFGEPESWASAIQQHRGSISIVVAPPPSIREYMKANPGETITERSFLGAQDAELRTQAVREYDKTMKLLVDLLKQPDGESHVYEAYALPEHSSKLV